MANNDKNPRNPLSPLFQRLTKLFSGPIINYRSQTGRRLRRQHLDKYATSFKSASGKQFKKSTYQPLDIIATNAIANQRRSERYIDFDQMEYMPEIASAMDIYADEMTTASDLQELLRIRCPNEEIKAILHTLYHNILNINSNLYGWSRTMCKYGDFFLYLDIDEDHGIKMAIPLPPQEVERLEGEDKTNPNYIQYQWNSAGMTFENWQIAHFRVLGNDKYAPYGSSILEPARRIWRQLVLMEDAMMAYRVVRSSERRVFYIDVGSIAPQDVEQYMQKVVTQMKRNQVVDPDTGRVDLRYNPLSIEEDYFIPLRAGQSSRIENLGGGANTTAIEDIKYLRDKLFAALKVPMSYLIRGDGAEEDKTTLAQKDVRFARTIQRLQRVVVSELEKIGIIHLYTLGFRGDDLLSFKLTLNNPSKIAELQELEHWEKKFGVASAATEGFFSRRWIADRLFAMSEEEFLRNQREMFYDKKFDASLEAAATAVAEASAAGGIGGELGGELGGEELAGELGGELGGEELGGEELAGEEEGMLLAEPEAPANRDAPKVYIGPHGASSPYTPVKRDRRKMAGLGKNMRRAVSPEISPRTWSPGAQEMRKYSRGSIYESKESTYSMNDKQTEDRLFQVNHEIRNIIQNLESEFKLESGDDEENKA